MKKKILFVIDSLSSGGAEKSLVTLLNLLDTEKYDIDLLLSTNGGLYSELVPEKINTQIIPKASKTLRIYRLFYSLALRINFYLGRKIHPAQLHWLFFWREYLPPDEVYDIAIAYSQGLPTYYVAEHVNARIKISWVNTNYRTAGYKSFLDKSKYEKITNIIVVSEDAKNIFLAAHPNSSKKTQVIYDLISKEVILRMANESNPYCAEENGIRILTIGRLVSSKGYEIALIAARELKKSNIKFRWYIIGEGNLEPNLKKMVSEYGLEDQISFLGIFANPYPFIKNCDIYCQTSRFEGFGLAIAEARALQRPIVATNFDVVHNQIKHGHNGIITNMDGKSVAAGITKLIENPKLYQDIVNNLQHDTVDSTSELIKIERLISA